MPERFRSIRAFHFRRYTKCYTYLPTYKLAMIHGLPFAAQRTDVARRHLCRFRLARLPQQPRPARKWFSKDRERRGRSNPGCRIGLVRSVTRTLLTTESDDHTVSSLLATARGHVTIGVCCGVMCLPGLDPDEIVSRVLKYVASVNTQQVSLDGWDVVYNIVNMLSVAACHT